MRLRIQVSRNTARDRPADRDEAGERQQTELVEFLSHEHDAAQAELHAEELGGNHGTPGEALGELDADIDPGLSGGQHDGEIDPQTTHPEAPGIIDVIGRHRPDGAQRRREHHAEPDDSDEDEHRGFRVAEPEVEQGHKGQQRQHAGDVSREGQRLAQERRPADRCRQADTGRDAEGKPEFGPQDREAGVVEERQDGGPSR